MLSRQRPTNRHSSDHKAGHPCGLPPLGTDFVFGIIPVLKLRKWHNILAACIY